VIVFSFCTTFFALAKSYTLLWKLQRGKKNVVVFDIFVDCKDFECFWFLIMKFHYSLYFIDSFVLHFPATYVVFCCKAHLWNKGGRSYFSLPTFNNCCVHSSFHLLSIMYFIGLHQVTKLCFYISSFLFLLEGVLCKWGKTLERLPRQLYRLFSKLKTLNCHILFVVEFKV
jgi:hypothetical protein